MTTDVDPDAAIHEAAQVRSWYIDRVAGGGVTVEDAAGEFERVFPELARMARAWGEREVTC